MQSADEAEREYRRRRVAHWDGLARLSDAGPGWGGYYHARLAAIYRRQISPGLKVLEIGCARGDLLAALEPAEGVGIDFSGEMIARARCSHPQLTFVEADAHAVPLTGPFDVIVLSDLVNDAWDVQRIFAEVRRLSSPATRILLNLYSRVWEMPLAIAGRLGVARSNLPQNWLTVEDLTHLFELTGLEVVRRWEEFLLPLPVPPLAPLANRILARLWPFRVFSLTNILIARPMPGAQRDELPARVSVVVPAGTKRETWLRSSTECRRWGPAPSSSSWRATSETSVQRAGPGNPRRPGVDCQLHRQTGAGKGDAVRMGFVQATGDILMILDADLTVAPEDLPRFYNALVEARGNSSTACASCTRWKSRRCASSTSWGTSSSAWPSRWLLGQPDQGHAVRDKGPVARGLRAHLANRATSGISTRSAISISSSARQKLDLKIVDMPIRYRDRTYGTTNINRWRHGSLLIRMVAFAATHLRMTAQCARSPPGSPTR